VTDEVAFTQPGTFETALVTLGRWEKRDDGSLVVYDADEAVRVDVAATGGDIDVRAEQIKEDVRTRSLPTRIGIAFKQPVAKASIRLRITPATAPRARGG